MSKSVKTQKPTAPAKKQTVKGKESKPAAGSTLTAKQFIDRVKSYQSDIELKKIQRYFKSGEGQYS